MNRETSHFASVFKEATIYKLSHFLMKLGILSALFGAPLPAMAEVTCSVSMGDVSFGDLDFLANSDASYTNSALSYSCSNPEDAVMYVNACVSLPSSSKSNFAMLNNDGEALLFELRNGLTNTVWSGVGIPDQSISIMLAINSKATSTGQIPITGVVYGGQRSLSAGLYSLFFSDAATSLTWVSSPTQTPSYCTGQNNAAGVAFTASATIKKSCSIRAGSLDFGSASMQQVSGVTAQTQIYVLCTPGSSYSLSLNSLQAENANFYMRGLNRLGDVVTIPYYLYQDPARSLVWVPSSFADYTSTKNTPAIEQAITIYGYVPGTSLATSPGVYTDTINIQMTY